MDDDSAWIRAEQRDSGMNDYKRRVEPRPCRCGGEPNLVVRQQPDGWRVNCYCGRHTTAHPTCTEAMWRWNYVERDCSVSSPAAEGGK